MWQSIKNIYFLGVKELIELLRDPCMLILIGYAFSIGIYVSAIGTPDTVQNAPIAVVDEDHTQLSERIIDAMLPPTFQLPEVVPMERIDPGMDRGDYTFSLVIPAEFQKNVLSGKKPEIQLNVDATRMTQAFTGSGYIQQIVDTEIKNFLGDNGQTVTSPATVSLRNKFNANLVASWFGGVNQLVNYVTMLAIVLIGAALIRERERGTLEHLLVMPVEPFQIMCAKIWSMLVVVCIASMFSVIVILKNFLSMPVDGSLFLYLIGIALHLFAVTSMGISLACMASNMPQMGMLILLVLMPMSMLSGGVTPRESMPQWVQTVMEVAPTTHFVQFSQQILFRGAGIDIVWKPFLAIAVIGLALFLYSLRKFRKTATQS